MNRLDPAFPVVFDFPYNTDVSHPATEFPFMISSDPPSRVDEPVISFGIVKLRVPQNPRDTVLDVELFPE